MTLKQMDQDLQKLEDEVEQERLMLLRGRQRMLEDPTDPFNYLARDRGLSLIISNPHSS